MALSTELDIHKSKGFIDQDVLTLVLEDPKERVGSGGATLNALMVVTEHLSAQAGYTVSGPASFYPTQCSFVIGFSDLIDLW